MPLFLIRHPRPLIESGVCYGQLDVEAEDPARLADQLAARLPARIPIISSPLRRARVLAEALGKRLDAPVHDDPRLREIDFGNWEGQRWEAIDRALLDAWAADILYFTPPGGEVILRAVNDEGSPRIEVLDTGPGIPQAERVAVFQRFYRSDDKHGGFGLGLSIVAAIVNLHGFSLDVGDREGGGAKLTLHCRQSLISALHPL